MKTKRFFLKKLSPKHANSNYLSWFNNDDVKKFILAAKNKINLDELKKFIKDNNSKKNTLLFGIFSKSQKHIGNIKFDKIDKKNNSVLLGILIGDLSYRRKGVATEIINFFSKYFYLQYNISNILLGVDKKNLIAIKTYKKINFRIVPQKKNIKKSLLMCKSYNFEEKVIIGTAQFIDNYGINRVKEKINLSQKKRIVKNSIKNNFNYFDTSNSYSDYVNVFDKYDKHKIILKLYPEDNIKDYKLWINKQITKYQKIFNTKRFYAIIVHNEKFLQTPDFDIFIKLLIDLKKNHITEKIGISIYTFSSIIKNIKKYKFDIVQCPFSLIDRRLIENNLLDKLKKIGTEVHVRSIFLQGLLFKKNVDPYFFKWKKIFTYFRKWTKNNHLSNLEGSLFFILNYPKIDKIIIGVEDINQIKELNEAIKKYRYIEYPKDLKSSNINLINPNKWVL